MTTAKRPPLQRAHTRTTEAKRNSELDTGLSILDSETGERLTVRVRDVKGVHDMQLRAVCGMDFMSLMTAVGDSPGLDLLCAVVWMARLVNGKDPGDFNALLNELGWDDVFALDLDEAKEATVPEALGGDSVKSSPRSVASSA